MAKYLCGNIFTGMLLIISNNRRLGKNIKVHYNDGILSKSLKFSFIANKYWEDIRDIRSNERNQHPDSEASRGGKTKRNMPKW